MPERTIDTPNTPRVKLSDGDGSTPAMIALAGRAAREAGWTREQWEAVQTEALSSDYDHVLQTLQMYFDVA